MQNAEAPREIIDGKAVRTLVEAQAIRGATILGQPGGWAVLVRYGTSERAVAAQRARRPRLWRNLNTAAAFVRDDLGVTRFDVDTMDHQPEANERRRPDQAAALRRTHAAAAHDAWFRAEVEKAIAEADAPDAIWIPHEEVGEDMRRQREAIEARLAAAQRPL
jgi:hypothetical protein